MISKVFAVIKEFLRTHKHVWLFLYTLVYLAGFELLEARNGVEYNIIHTPLDDRIPFNEIFIVPYFLWFAYIAFVLIRLCIKSRNDFIKSFIYIFGGMTIGLIIFALFPTAQELRPAVMPRENILARLTFFLYSIDTPTNVCPSLHVYVAIGAYIGIRRGETYFTKAERISAFILTVAICLATMFLKQHSVFDVVTGIIMSFIMYFIIYIPNYSCFSENAKDGNTDITDKAVFK